MTKHLDTIGFHEKFYESKYGKAIIEKLNSPISGENDETLLQVVSRKFANSRWKSFKLLVHRELLLWCRDKVSGTSMPNIARLGSAYGLISWI